MGMKGLTDRKLEQLSKQPIIETQVHRSKDGKWIIHKTIITDIKSAHFYEKVIEHAGGPTV